MKFKTDKLTIDGQEYSITKLGFVYQAKKGGPPAHSFTQLMAAKEAMSKTMAGQMESQFAAKVPLGKFGGLIPLQPVMTTTTAFASRPKYGITPLMKELAGTERIRHRLPLHFRSCRLAQLLWLQEQCFERSIRAIHEYHQTTK